MSEEIELLKKIELNTRQWRPFEKLDYHIAESQKILDELNELGRERDRMSASEASSNSASTVVSKSETAFDRARKDKDIAEMVRDIGD